MQSNWDLNKIAIAAIILIAVILLAYFAFFSPKDEKKNSNNFLTDFDSNKKTDANVKPQMDKNVEAKNESKDKNLEGTTVLIPEPPKQPEKIVSPENVKQPDLGKESDTKQPAR